MLAIERRAGVAERLVFGRQAFNQLAAGAHVSRDSGNARGITFQNDQGQGFADRGEDGQANFRHQVIDLLKTEETDVFLQAQAAHQVLAFFGVAFVFILRAGDPAFCFRQVINDAAHRPDEGFDVLDRYDAPDQAEYRGRCCRPQVA